MRDRTHSRIYPDIGARLRDLRKARGCTIDYLSERSGYSTGYLSRLENGSRHNPTVAFIWDTSKALGVSPSVLLGIEDT